jgi:hypothetical protein
MKGCFLESVVAMLWLYLLGLEGPVWEALSVNPDMLSGVWR